MELYYTFVKWLGLLLLPACAFTYAFFFVITDFARYCYLHARSLTITGWTAWCMAMLLYFPSLLITVTIPPVIVTPDWLWLFFSLLAMLLLLIKQLHLQLWKGRLFLFLLMLLNFQEFILYYWILPWFDRDILPSYWTPAQFNWQRIIIISLLMIIVIVSLHRRSKPEEQ